MIQLNITFFFFAFGIKSCSHAPSASSPSNQKTGRLLMNAKPAEMLAVYDSDIMTTRGSDKHHHWQSEHIPWSKTPGLLSTTVILSYKNSGLEVQGSTTGGPDANRMSIVVPLLLLPFCCFLSFMMLINTVSYSFISDVGKSLMEIIRAPILTPDSNHS